MRSTIPIESHEQSALWNLALRGLPIDADALAAAVENELRLDGADFRTRLLIRDSLDALREHWGSARYAQWVAKTGRKTAIEEAQSADLGPAGFPSLTCRIVEATRPEIILQFLRELSLHCRQPTRLEIGGAASLILAELLIRRTEDIDAVDEVPAALRVQHEILENLSRTYGLQLRHFQSHYLPNNWQSRLRRFSHFGDLEILLVDPADVIVGKLFSQREKDRTDLRAVIPKLGRELIVNRLKRDGISLLGEPRLRQFAADNWYILFGEPLPS